jgi:anthranilate synthase
MGNLRIPVFGVCLGLQGMVEHFGGELGVLGYPMHGKPSPVFLTEPGQGANSIFDGLPQSFEVARYHSLHGLKDKMPSCLEITAITEDGIVMGIQHKTLPIAGVQFHPESILTSPVHGMTILKNALKTLKYNDHIEQSKSESQHESNHQIPSTTVDTNLPLSDLKKILKAAGLTVSGTKDELTDKLIHWVTLRDQHKAGTLVLDQMTVNQLKDLKHQLGLKGATNTKDSLVQAVRECLTSN